MHVMSSQYILLIRKGTRTQMILLTIVVKVILDSKPSSDHLIFDSLIHPAGSKRYIRLNLNMRGERKLLWEREAAHEYQT